MRRTATALGCLALATALPVASAAPAQAAQGTLTVGFQRFENPSGCYTASLWPMSVQNDADTRAVVYSGPDCTGEQVGVVEPGESGVFEFGTSVRID
ncbi:hypothetical protein [Allonocardiopsis opalescens]|uniref:Beta/gamma crystallin n=1 Tax=Allonocardiopsis opalescens TaxID=1144618 RepID=A0A2T0Q0G3_9ACTN|nr:hypothetical protein [Allonocardiopsis opalescens]PRX97163.1 hypothetical protein CLV72_106199 [Allonocardiopsis opalescens]